VSESPLLIVAALLHDPASRGPDHKRQDRECGGELNKARQKEAHHKQRRSGPQTPLPPSAQTL